MLQELVHNIRVGLAQGILILAICVAIEHVAVIERYRLRDRIPGAVFQILGTVFGGFVAWSLQQLWDVLGFGHIAVPLYSWLRPLPFGGAAYVLAMLAITDFLTYWRHRAEHKWFWPIHAVHHAPTELHAANDIGHPLQAIPNFLFVSIPLSLIQMPGPEIPVAVGLLSGLITVYIHSPIDFHFGPLRRVIVDNRFHRIHHSLEPRHFEKNFSVGFGLWDMIFGTAYWPEKSEWPAVGVAGVPAPKTITDYLALPVRMWRKSFVRQPLRTMIP